MHFKDLVTQTTIWEIPIGKAFVSVGSNLKKMNTVH